MVRVSGIVEDGQLTWFVEECPNVCGTVQADDDVDRAVLDAVFDATGHDGVGIMAHNALGG